MKWAAVLVAVIAACAGSGKDPDPVVEEAPPAAASEPTEKQPTKKAFWIVEPRDPSYKSYWPEGVRRPHGWPPSMGMEPCWDQRYYMVEILKGRGIADEQVLRAMGDALRHDHVLKKDRARAYADIRLLIGPSRTVQPPYVVAKMAEAAHVRAGMKVLEIGTGCAYQTAVLAHLTPFVYSIEPDQALARRCVDVLELLSYQTVQVRHSAGYEAWSDEAPFDCILVTAAMTEIPPQLLAQLKPGGRLVIPLGAGEELQDVWLVTKNTAGEVSKHKILEHVEFEALPPQSGERTADSGRR
ncbi:MAG: protein-L-isoaspartate O-methyltransferase [Planctomycetota bacterium]|nr:protein-L-isoaspartate O-methyltransferase [Planctomycetota bacterium]